MRATFPTDDPASKDIFDADAVRDMALIMGCYQAGIRNIRGEMNISRQKH
ncbi:MAG: hypothetical protein R2875_03320 [Desulfobacterales bacterium]